MTLLKNAFIAGTLLAAQGANAWTLKWRDTEGAVTVESGKGTAPCKPIEHAEDRMFNWDPKGDDVCIWFYADDLCEEGIAGKSCPIWDKASSRDLLAFKVVSSENDGDGPGVTTGDSTATATDTGSSSPTGTASETETASATGTETGTESGSGTSEPTGDSTETVSKTASASETETVTKPAGTATDAPSQTGPQGTDAPSSSPATDAPATSTQTGAAAPTGLPAAGVFGAIAAVAAAAL